MRSAPLSEACAVSDLSERQIDPSDPALTKTFAKYASPLSGAVDLEGFASFLMSSDNAVIKDEAKQDMTRPMPEYFISSSHNVRGPLVGDLDSPDMSIADLPYRQPVPGQEHRRRVHSRVAAGLSQR